MSQNCATKKSSPPTQQPASELRPGKGSREGAVAKAELEVLRQKAADLALQKADKAAAILADWLKRPAGRKKAG